MYTKTTTPIWRLQWGKIYTSMLSDKRQNSEYSITRKYIEDGIRSCQQKGDYNFIPEQRLLIALRCLTSVNFLFGNFSALIRTKCQKSFNESSKKSLIIFMIWYYFPKKTSWKNWRGILPEVWTSISYWELWIVRMLASKALMEIKLKSFEIGKFFPLKYKKLLTQTCTFRTSRVAGHSWCTIFHNSRLQSEFHCDECFFLLPAFFQHLPYFRFSCSSPHVSKWREKGYNVKPE